MRDRNSLLHLLKHTYPGTADGHVEALLRSELPVRCIRGMCRACSGHVKGMCRACAGHVAWRTVAYTHARYA